MNQRLTVAAHILGMIAFLQDREGRPVTSDELAESVGTNPAVVRRILADLGRAGLTRSKRGPGGGTSLARAPEAIDLRQVWEAITSDEQRLLPRRTSESSCEVAPVIEATSTSSTRDSRRPSSSASSRSRSRRRGVRSPRASGPSATPQPSPQTPWALTLAHASGSRHDTSSAPPLESRRAAPPPPAKPLERR